jgi:hypothetical protein
MRILIANVPSTIHPGQTPDFLRARAKRLQFTETAANAEPRREEFAQLCKTWA